MEKQFGSDNGQVEIIADHSQVTLRYLVEKRLFDIFCGVFGMALVLVCALFLIPFCFWGKNKGPLFLNKYGLDKTAKNLLSISSEVW